MKRDRKTHKPTLKDIAGEAKVSTTTVSIVLKDKETTRVGAATRKRIIEIAERFNYRPNYAARALVTRESRSIGLVITTLENPFYSEIAQDIITRAKETGYGVIASSVRGGIDDERRTVYDLLDRGVDGLIICSALRHDPLIPDLIDQGIQFVLTLRGVHRNLGDPPVDYIGVNNERGGYLAVEHLLKMGHKRIGLLSGDMKTSTGYERHAGALAAFEAYSMQPAPELILNGDFDRKTGFRLTLELLKIEERPTAIFAHNDHMAIGVLEALREKGLRVPEDMAVIGFDDIEMAGLPGVDLTTVTPKKATMGRMAVDTLLEKIKGPSISQLVKRIILDPILIIRQSCGFYSRGSKYELHGHDGQKNYISQSALRPQRFTK